MGDLNLPKQCITWGHSDDGTLVPLVAGHGEGETVGGKQNPLQAKQLVDMASKHSLSQEVERPTQSVEILDLVFSNNCELVSNITVEKCAAFSDHNLIICNTAFQLSKEQVQLEQQFLCDIGKRYGALNFCKAPWQEVKVELAKIDWTEIEDLAKSCPTTALSKFHEIILPVLEKLVPKKAKKSSKPKIHRMRRLLWRRLAKAKRKFQAASSISKTTEYMQKIWDIESQLAADYTASNTIEENEAVMKIKSNSKAFFTFARSRQKVRAKVGPFLDPETGRPNPSPDFAAECLRNQYNSVFAVPRPEWKVDNFTEHFKEVVGDNILSDIEFTQADMQQACAQL